MYHRVDLTICREIAAHPTGSQMNVDGFMNPVDCPPRVSRAG
jgi:hypothetical protein